MVHNGFTNERIFFRAIVVAPTVAVVKRKRKKGKKIIFILVNK